MSTKARAGGSGSKKRHALGTEAEPAKKPRHEPSSRDARPYVDLGVLKALKRSLRALITTLQAIRDEGTMLERMWYKNAAQFKSALWWRSLNGLRRSLHPLATTATLTTTIAELYADLAGAEPPKLHEGWPVLPRLTSPSAETIRQTLEPPEAAARLNAIQHALDELAHAVEAVEKRATKAGEVLVVHLNTPPAPTFAPLVSALLALSAGVHTQAKMLTATENPINDLRRILDQLHSATGQT